MTEPRRASEHRGGLFGRILLTFVATALLSALVAAVAGYSFAARFSSEWIADVEEVIEERATELDAASGDQATMLALIEDMGEQLDARVGIYRRKGRRGRGDGPRRAPLDGHQLVLGEGPPHPPPIARHHRRALREGKTVVVRGRRFEPPGVLRRISDPNTGKSVGVLAVLPKPYVRLMLPGLALLIVLMVLGAGAWVLSRSLTRRLARIETSAGRIARGELEHRIELDTQIPRDELDQLASAFNEMANKVEALLRGQRTLLANVSHELRTPIARMKVLVEILQERVEMLQTRGDTSRPVQRLDKGLGDLAIDISEIETLISDLLTSGRLELRHGSGGALRTSSIDLKVLLERVAAKVDATVDLPAQDGSTPDLVADELLIERLLSNLLANARRACPDGALTISAAHDEEHWTLVVEDEGPGVDPANRESIFEPFTRLDEARDRDRGGVGLGLYLCRQICLSHEGSIEVTDRLDGRSGARFVVTLPLRRSEAA